MAKMNSTDTINLNNAKLITILNAGREQLDRLRGDINTKSQLVDVFDEYPEELEQKVEAEIQIDMEDVKEDANETVQEIVRKLTDRSEQKLQEQLRRKTELQSRQTELQIQTELLERTAERHIKCLAKLEQILKDGEARFEKMSKEWNEEMLVD
ncbi:hypothetical protein M3Y97_00664900 [Aphelenchoides bicaudatus]|nr:hypothetical protein M3Y97_00664900 [Aphelenchoides bicaudatus]